MSIIMKQQTVIIIIKVTMCCTYQIKKEKRNKSGNIKNTSQSGLNYQEIFAPHSVLDKYLISI